jgi:hypothetical protein
MAYESLYDMQYVTLPACAVRDLSSNVLPTHPLSSKPDFDASLQGAQQGEARGLPHVRI